MLERATAALGRLIDAVRVNHTVVRARVCVKRRRWFGGVVIVPGNVFLWLSRSRIRMFVGARRWQDLELAHYRLLYGRRGRRVGSWTIVVPRLPGTPLLDLALTPLIVAAAGRELRRAHGLSWPDGTGWSHGDVHLANILYDEVEDRARGIDFEVVHEAGVSALERRADDLLVPLLDLLGRDGWEPLAQAFLAAYDDVEVEAALRARLKVPRGLEAVLWKTRTAYLATAQLAARLDALRAWLR